MIKQFYFKQFSLACHQSKWFQVLLCITTNSTKHQSFVHTVKWSNSSISNNSLSHKLFPCSQFKCQTLLFDPYIGPYQVLHTGPKWIRERWQWWGTSHSLKHQYRCLTLRLFIFISKTLVKRGRGLTLQLRCSRSILQLQPTERKVTGTMYSESAGTPRAMVICVELVR